MNFRGAGWQTVLLFDSPASSFHAKLSQRHLKSLGQRICLYYIYVCVYILGAFISLTDTVLVYIIVEK